MLTSVEIKAHADFLGFELCGIAPAGNFPELRFFREWLDRGFAGEMNYLNRTADRRSDVRRVLPSAKTVIALGTVYNVDRPYSTEQSDPDQAHVSRYAWGKDYHTVVGKRTEHLLSWMREKSPDSFEAKAYVDTGPIQERVYAQHAGLGWIGKNSCLINEGLGSWLFLSEIICSLELGIDEPATDQCGSCTLCLEACPTGAIVEPWVVDSTRCVSYLTIELPKVIPEASRPDVGSHVYGCDICQDVCPWNAQAATSSDAAWKPVPLLDQPRLPTLWRQPDSVLRPVVKQSAMARGGVRRLRRNIAVALGNSGSSDAEAALHEPAGSGSRSDSLVETHAEWARRRLRRARDESL